MSLWISKERSRGWGKRPGVVYYTIHDKDTGDDDVRWVSLSATEYASIKKAFDDMGIEPDDPRYDDGPAICDRFAETQNRLAMLYSISRLR